VDGNKRSIGMAGGGEKTRKPSLFSTIATTSKKLKSNNQTKK
jgi:hypothetical protein